MSEEFQRPVPRPRPESRPFWEGCRNEQFLLQRCNHCSTINWFPRDYCVQCGHAEFTWQPASGRGELETFSIVYRAMNPAWESELPYMLGMVKLDEGIRMATRIESHHGEETKIGSRVRVKFVPVAEGFKLPYFQLDESGSA